MSRAPFPFQLMQLGKIYAIVPAARLWRAAHAAKWVAHTYVHRYNGLRLCPRQYKGYCVAYRNSAEECLDQSLNLQMVPEQAMKVSPTLIMVNQLLALSSIELQQMVRAEMEDNPALEAAETT